MLGQRNRGSGYPSIRASAPDFRTQGKQRGESVLPRHLDDTTRSEGEPQTTLQPLRIFPSSDSAEQRPARHLGQPLGHRHRHSEKPSIGALKADIREREKGHMRVHGRTPFRGMAADSFGDWLLCIMHDGRAHRAGNFRRTRSGKGSRAMRKLEHDPVTSSIRLPWPSRFQDL